MQLSLLQLHWWSTNLWEMKCGENDWLFLLSDLPLTIILQTHLTAFVNNAFVAILTSYCYRGIRAPPWLCDFVQPHWYGTTRAIKVVSLITIISNGSLLTISSSHDCGLCRHKHNHQWHWEIAHYSKCVTRNEVNCSVGNKSQPQMSVVIFVSAAIIHWNCHPHT